MRVGVVGLGIMGGAFARHLLAAGYEVLGVDPEPARREALTAAGGVAMVDAAALAPCETVMLSLPSAAALATVARSLAGLGPGTVVVELSTIAVADKEAARDVLLARGIVMLDCPVSGTGAQAASGDAVFYASGPAEAMARVRPVLTAMGRAVFDAGAFGNGMRLKLVANHLVTVHNLAAAEAMAAAEAAGLDLALVQDAIRSGAGNSRIFELRAPLMAERRYQPATMKLGLHMKDLGLIADFLATSGTAAPLFTASVAVYHKAIAEGRAEEDTAALCEVLRRRV